MILILVKQCPPPDQVISHGRSLSLQLIFTQGDSVQYLCDVGYVIAGSNSATMTISCQGDGTWNPAIPSCTSKFCQFRFLQLIFYNIYSCFFMRIFSINSMFIIYLMPSILHLECNFNEALNFVITIYPKNLQILRLEHSIRKGIA